MRVKNVHCVRASSPRMAPMHRRTCRKMNWSMALEFPETLLIRHYAIAMLALALIKSKF